MNQRFYIVILIGLTLLVSAPTWWYPFGRDQGQYAYFARQWAAGSIPYLELWDQKPPGFYFLIRLFQAILGDRIPTPRLADVVGAIIIQLLLYSMSKLAKPGVDRLAGFLSAAAVPFVYFGGFIYWDTGQPELWETLFITASFWAVLKRGSNLRVMIGGFSVACSILVKLPAIVIIPAILGILLIESRQDRYWTFTRITLAGIAAALPLGAILLPLMLRNGVWAEMMDILVRYNSFYVKVKSTEITLLDLIWQPFSFQMEAPATLLLAGLGLIIGRWFLSKRVYAISLVWFASVFLSLAIQKKYYLYHYVVLFPSVCFFAGLGSAACIIRFRRARKWVRRGLYLLFAIVFIGGQVRYFYWSYIPRWWDYVTGRIGWFRFYTQFGGPDNYVFMSNAKIARFLNLNADPDDLLAVEGYEPAIYTLTGLRCPSRFYSVFPLVDPKLKAFNPGWTIEYQQSLARSEPRWLITTGAPPLYLPAEYTRVETYKELTVWVLTKPGSPIPVFEREQDEAPPVILPQ